VLHKSHQSAFEHKQSADHQTRTCCSINGEEALGVSRDKTIRDSLLGILIVVGGIELDDFGASWAVFRHRWVINGLLRQWHIIVLVVNLNENLYEEDKAE
jgi:hypothetical protein